MCSSLFVDSLQALTECISANTDVDAKEVFFGCLHPKDTGIKPGEDSHSPTYAPSENGSSNPNDEVKEIDIESSVDHYIDHAKHIEHMTCDRIVDCFKSSLPPNTCEAELTAENECWMHSHFCEKEFEVCPFVLYCTEHTCLPLH